MKENIIIENSCIHQLKHLIPFHRFSKIILLTDHIVKELYGTILLQKLSSICECYMIDFVAGEAQKTRKTKEWIEDELMTLGAGKDSLLITVGGGVVSDLGGFVASTYFRGIAWISIPTTLMGMIDASIGGKTGVNTFYGKNIIGSFYLPSKIIIDPCLLNTLPKEECLSGFAEVIKYGCLSDLSLLEIDSSIVPSCRFIEKCIDIKLSFIQPGDLSDRFFRNHLNLGHTIGHAIECLSNFSLSHGICVAIGLLIEGKINVLKGYLSCNNYIKIKKAVHMIFPYLPISVLCDIETLYRQVLKDKKSSNQIPSITILKQLGSVLSQDEHFCSFKKEELALAVEDVLSEITCYSI